MIHLIGLLTAAILVALDQFTKLWAQETLAPRGVRDFIPGFMDFRFHTNHGAAFGILPGGRWGFVAFTVVVLIGIMVFYVKLPRTRVCAFIRAGMVLLAAGAVGNGIDRVRQGYVVDFLHFLFTQRWFNFPIFNLADVFVVSGSITLAILVIFFYKEAPKAEAENSNDPAHNDNN